MNAFLRIFGSGPLGVLLTIASLAVAASVRSRYPAGALALPAALRWFVLCAGCSATLAGIVWSFRSLPVSERGRGLYTGGAYRLVRHPLYASLITLAAPAAAVFLDHWAMLLWLPVLHLAWHVVIPIEERLMVDHFGDEYRDYARRTGRFVPRWQGWGGSRH